MTDVLVVWGLLGFTFGVILWFVTGTRCYDQEVLDDEW